MKVIDAVNFIRSKGLLKHWTNEQIAIGIKNALDSCCITYTMDSEDKMTGLVFGKWEEEGTIVDVTLLAGEGKPLMFLRYLRDTFPNCKTVKFGRLKYKNDREFQLI